MKASREMTPGQVLKEEVAWGAEVQWEPVLCNRGGNGLLVFSLSSLSVRVAYSGQLHKDSSLIHTVRVNGT